MLRNSHCVWVTMMSFLLAVTLPAASVVKMPPTNPPQASSQDKAKACNDAADKKGLKDEDRKTFMQSCLGKVAGSGSGSNASQQDKATTCKNLADKKGVTGADRKSFMKDCMNRANP
jgi:hypothetical protein